MTSEPASHREDPIQGKILHVYDGIEEADNHLPMWWLATFYGAIIFSVFYWFVYHEFEAAPLPLQQYAEALNATAGDTVTEEMLVALVDDSDTVHSGEETFKTNCAVCHEADGRGKIGPNLTDDHWIHGGSALDIYGTVDKGVLDKGMPAWGSTLGSKAVKGAVAYVLTLRGKNIPGKEPQGEVWKPGSSDNAQAVGAAAP